jgi:hypothetical protein
MASSAQHEHTAKIQEAKRLREDEKSRKIKEDRIQEWALLDISEWSQGIHFQLTQSNTPKLTSPKSDSH